MGDFGYYKFNSLDHIINQFLIGYVWEGKIKTKKKKNGIQIFEMKAIQKMFFYIF